MKAIRTDLFIKQACRQVSEVSCVGKYKAHHLYPKNLQTSRLYADQEATVGTGRSKLGMEYIKAMCCHLSYLTYMRSKSCEKPG